MASRVNKIKKTPATMEEAMDRFITWKKANGISEQTLLDYTTHIRLLYKRYPEARNSYDELENAVCKHLSQEGIKPATYNNRLVYLRTFFKWCCEHDVLEDNPLNGFKKRKDEGRPVTIDEEMLARLITLPNQETFAGLRDYALFLMFLDCGIRPKEAFGLMEDDFHPRAYEIRIDAAKAKTRVSRTLPLSPITVDAISELISIHPEEWKRKAPIFCINEGKPLTRHTWGDRVEMYGKKQGIYIWPYALRHAFSVVFLRGGGNAFSLQRMLGHVDMTMTKRYVRLSDNDMKEQHSTASPLCFYRMKTRHRRMTGLSSWNRYLWCNGEFVIWVKDALMQENVQHRLQQVSYETFFQEWRQWESRLLEGTKRLRFRREPQQYLAQLEQRACSLIGQT